MRQDWILWCTFFILCELLRHNCKCSKQGRIIKSWSCLSLVTLIVIHNKLTISNMIFIPACMNPDSCTFQKVCILGPRHFPQNVQLSSSSHWPCMSKSYSSAGESINLWSSIFSTNSAMLAKFRVFLRELYFVIDAWRWSRSRSSFSSLLMIIFRSYRNDLGLSEPQAGEKRRGDVELSSIFTLLQGLLYFSVFWRVKCTPEVIVIATHNISGIYLSRATILCNSRTQTQWSFIPATV